jgi:hypothetical protein
VRYVRSKQDKPDKPRANTLARCGAFCPATNVQILCLILIESVKRLVYVHCDLHVPKTKVGLSTKVGLLYWFWRSLREMRGGKRCLSFLSWSWTQGTGKKKVCGKILHNYRLCLRYRVLPFRTVVSAAAAVCFAKCFLGGRMGSCLLATLLALVLVGGVQCASGQTLICRVCAGPREGCRRQAGLCFSSLSLSSPLFQEGCRKKNNITCCASGFIPFAMAILFLQFYFPVVASSSHLLPFHPIKSSLASFAFYYYIFFFLEASVM